MTFAPDVPDWGQPTGIPPIIDLVQHVFFNSAPNSATLITASGMSVVVGIITLALQTAVTVFGAFVVSGSPNDLPYFYTGPGTLIIPMNLTLLQGRNISVSVNTASGAFTMYVGCTFGPVI